MKPAYLLAGDDEAKIVRTRGRLRDRAEREGGPGALEVFEAGDGRRSPDVLRASAHSEDLVAVSDGDISASTFTDRVEHGVPYQYAVQAVDNVGNVSAASVDVEETAR